MILTAIHGFCMALADSVPGVSGGTIAFILGFYDRFLNALHSLFGKDADARKSAIIYLLKLGLGWIFGMGACVLTLSRLFEAHIYFMSSLFLGLTPASFPFVLRAEKKIPARAGAVRAVRAAWAAARRAADAAPREYSWRGHPLCGRASLDAGLHFPLRRGGDHGDGAAWDLRFDDSAHRGRLSPGHSGHQGVPWI